MSSMGVWMWPESVRAHGAERVIARCGRLGVTDIYFLTKGLSGTVSYRSSLAPSDGERDLLAELLDAAHARGIRVHAWFTSACDEHYKALHPESGRYHYLRGRDKGLISLADPGYLSYMEAIVCELCRALPVDGLHLDYIRYNHLTYGWAPEDLARYAAHGADPARLRALMERAFPGGEGAELFFEAWRAGDPDVLALARARRADVRAFAAALTGAARAARPGLILSAALMPEVAYEDIAFADVHYGQNLADAAALYDQVLIMAYSQAYGQDSAWVRRLAAHCTARGIRTVMGLHAYEGGTGDSLRADLTALAGVPVSGVCLFREGAFALADWAEGRLRVFNPLAAPITALTDGDAPLSLPGPVVPGTEAVVVLTRAPRRLRAFTAAGEVCVCLACKEE